MGLNKYLGFFRRVYNFVRRPIDNFRKVEEYNQMLSNYPCGVSEGSRNSSLAGIIKGLQEENSFLQRDVDLRTEELKKIRCDVEDALEACRYVRIGEDVIERRCEENASANQALQDWIYGPKARLEKENSWLRQRTSQLEGFAFGNMAGRFITNDREARKMPVVFYDFENKGTYLNSSAFRVLGVESRNSFSFLNLLGLVKNRTINYLGTEIKTRRYLVEILKRGVPLDNFEIEIEGRKSKFYLTTRQIDYTSRRNRDVKQRKSFGILMFIDTAPSFLSFTKLPKNKKKMEHILSSLRKELDIIDRAGRKIKV